jgi:outer membrane protein assembly factor BamB
LALAGVVAAEEWPQWRGPKDDGIVREEKIAESWPAGGPRKLWEQQVGTGFASPVAVEGKVYVFAIAGSTDTLYCFDAAAGKELWKQGYQSKLAGQMPREALRPDWTGTRASPVIESGKIYTYGFGGDLVCRDLADGKLLWHTNVLTETDATPITWAQASNPTIDGDVVYVQGGKGGALAVAVNKTDGKIIWKAEEALGGYAKITVADVAGQKQLIVFGGKALYGLNPADGKTLWSEPYETEYDVNAATPIYRDGKLLVTSSYRQGRITLYELSPSGLKTLWTNKEIKMRFQPPIVEDGYIYGTDGEPGTIKCLKWDDGSRVWQGDRISQGGSLVKVGDKLIAMSQTGKVILARATPQKYEKISEADLVARTNNAWSTPLVYQGKLFVKGRNELAAYDIK